MDKYEYKVRAEEIKKLVRAEEYAQAAEIADSIDWRKVKSVKMLCTISDLYKINRRYEDARDLLLLAYERRPGGRSICYSLCELSIKTGEIVQAMEYYKEFVRVAPDDAGRHILRYKIYKYQDVSLEERIEVLEELKKQDYQEKWAYELAYLYHRVGLATRCVEECDEMIVWFGQGEYVTKAMELKMLHQPLSIEQQEKYNHRFDPQPEQVEDVQPDEMTLDGQSGDSGDIPGDEDVQEYEDDLTGGATQIFEPVRMGNVDYDAQAGDVSGVMETYEGEPAETYAQEPTEALPAEQPEEMDIQVKTMDVGQYNTINLQAELAQGLQELLNAEQGTGAVAETVSGVHEETVSGNETADGEPEQEQTETLEESEVFFGETGEIVMEQMRREADQKSVAQQNLAEVEPPKEIAHVLSQESDGQISLVIPERPSVEKQITGQMNIEEVLAEWERMKKEHEEKRKEEVRQHVLQQTGKMFSEFEASLRDGLLEQLEKSVDDSGESQTDAETIIHLETVEEAVDQTQAAESGEEPADDNMDTRMEAGDPEEEPADGNMDTRMEAGDPEEEPADDDMDTRMEAGDPEEEPADGNMDIRMETDGFGEEPADDDIGGTEPAGDETGETTGTDVGKTDAVAAKDETNAPAGKLAVRPMTREEKELYANYIQSRDAKEQIVKAVDGISLAAYTGNLIVTGEAGIDTLTLAKNIIREVQATDSNFSGKVAKISGKGLNRKSVGDTLNQLQNGALIIQDACDMDEATVQDLYKSLQKESLGIVVLLQDETKVMNRFLKNHEVLLDAFTARVDVEAPSNDMLVSFGRQYAKEREFSIDELGVLALHNRIEQRQTIDHAVTTAEVKEIVDGAIYRANRKTPRHFFDILLAKRYDEEDMIVVTEKDFA